MYQQNYKSDSKLQNKSENYDDFTHRFQQAEYLPAGQKGIIFVGLSRAGKSTLACSLAGSILDVVHCNKEKICFLNPPEQKYKDAVKNTHQSVTQTPNFYLTTFNNQPLAIVDMPGHADNSKFRELINFHYIKTMAERLNEVSFIMVIQLSKEGKKYVLEEGEIKMMESFISIFSDCKENITIIINRVENKDQKSMKEAFDDAVKLHPSDSFKRFYNNIGWNRILLIERPEYQQNRKNHSWTSPANFQKLPGVVKYMALNKANYGKISLFQKGSFSESKKFSEKLENYVDTITSKIQKGNQILKKIILQTLVSIVEQKNIQSKQKAIASALSSFCQEQNIDQKDLQILSKEKNKNKNKIVIAESRLMETFISIFQLFTTSKNWKAEPLEIAKKIRTYVDQWIENIILTLVQEESNDLQKQKIKKNLNTLKIFYRRKFNEIQFLITSIPNYPQNITEKNMHEWEAKIDQIDGFSERFITYRQFFIAFGLSFIEKSQISVNKIVSLMRNLAEKIHNPKVLALKPSEIEEQFLIAKNFITLLQNFCDDPKQIQVTILKLEEAKLNIQCQSLLSFNGTIKLQIIKNIKGCIELYYKLNDSEFKLKLLNKMSISLEIIKDFKSALNLKLCLHLNNQALRLANLVQKEEDRYQILLKVGTELKNIGKFYHAEQCFEMAKAIFPWNGQKVSLAEEKGYFKIEEMNLKRSKMSEKLVACKEFEYWDWKKIDQEIKQLMGSNRINFNPQELGSPVSKTSVSMSEHNEKAKQLKSSV